MPTDLNIKQAFKDAAYPVSKALLLFGFGVGAIANPTVPGGPIFGALVLVCAAYLAERALNIFADGLDRPSVAPETGNKMPTAPYVP